MISRGFCVPSLVFILCALVLSILVSISLPFIPVMDIARTNFGNSVLQNSQGQSVTQIRFGIWSACTYDPQDDRTCLKTAHAYNVTIPTENKNDPIVVQASWTRGLVVHPLAAAVTLFALLLACSNRKVTNLVASLVSLLAALLTVIAFAIDIALFALVQHEMARVGGGVATKTGPGFWLTFASLILLILGGFTLCCGRARANKSADASITKTPTTKTGTTTPAKPPFFARFRRANKA